MRRNKREQVDAEIARRRYEAAMRDAEDEHRRYFWKVASVFGGIFALVFLVIAVMAVADFANNVPAGLA